MTSSAVEFEHLIRHGILEPIDLLIQFRYSAAAAMLILTGIDAMAHVNRPADAESGGREDFKEWMCRYIHLDGQTVISSDEWWEARNAIIHTFGVYSVRLRKGGMKLLVWGLGLNRAVEYNPNISSDLAIVDVGALREAFSRGVSTFLAEGLSESDTSRRDRIRSRLNELLRHIQVYGP